MNKTALKNFATNARKELIEKVKARAFKIGITDDNIKKTEFESSDAIYIDGKQLTIVEKKQREKLISRIKDLGYSQVVEEVAFTWFNRFTALRFMEVNNYLPSKVRVLSSSNPNSTEPDIIKEALTIDLDIEKELVYELKMNNKIEELFKYLVIKQCNSLNKSLPFLFETIDDYKDILFPDGILIKDSFLQKMTDKSIISESDWEQVEIIGWLYQFYIAEEKDRVFKAKSKYKPEEIPYATQLFTPGWIVQYMVQNSLGRYWVETHPEDSDLTENWKFYIRTLERNTEFQWNISSNIDTGIKIEEIKCFDPAMGSGHILVYMFDILYEIYCKCGYSEREIPRLIIENNLYGLDIDERARQLSCFSVVMKAMKYNKRFLRNIEKEGLKLNLFSIQETIDFDESDIEFISDKREGNKFDETKLFIEHFKHAKTIGSLLKMVRYDKTYLEEKLMNIQINPVNDILMEDSRNKVLNVLPALLQQSEVMSQKYDIIVTNPPYMGNRYMNDNLTNYLKREYPDSKSDLFASFMEIDHYLKPNGFLAMINQHSWMFISSFEKLREKIINNKSINSMLHLGSRAFDEIGGEIVQTAAFVLKNLQEENNKGIYIRLVEFKDAKEKERKTIEAIQNPLVNYRYLVDSKEYTKITGMPIAYWVSEKMKQIFHQNKKIGDICNPRVGLQTGDNDKFLRIWSEVNFDKIGFNLINSDSAKKSNKKWFPYNKGGEFRKWFGNNEYVVNWENDGYEIKNFKDEKGKLKSRPQNIDCYFKEGITWSFISSTNFGVRYSPSGFIFDVAGSSVFPTKEDMLFLTAYLNSNITYEFLKAQNPTMNFQVGNVSNIPLPSNIEKGLKDRIEELAKENIALSKLDWDFYEYSWDFKMHPLLMYKENATTINSAFNNFSNLCELNSVQMKRNQEEINQMFINVLDLKDEIIPEVSFSDIPFRMADQLREIKSFISYFVGCLLGRYSLNKEGLIFAGGKFDFTIYNRNTVSEDNILTIYSGKYFENDIVSKFIDFIEVIFSKENLPENVEYIADSIGRKDNESAKETISRYFLYDFYKDHVQIYKKKPIYWLFTSGKQKAFNCLIYMHRYDKSTLSRIRTDYLHEVLLRMDAEKKVLLDIINGDGTTKEIANVKKELKSLDLKIEELRAYDEKLHHMADKQIEIDLDDGVAVNYAKFEGLLAPIK